MKKNTYYKYISALGVSAFSLSLAVTAPIQADASLYRTPYLHGGNNMPSQLDKMTSSRNKWRLGAAGLGLVSLTGIITSTYLAIENELDRHDDWYDRYDDVVYINPQYAPPSPWR